MKYDGIDQPNQGTVYFPLTGSAFRFLIVRSNGDPKALAPMVRDAVRALEPGAPISNVATVADLVDQSLLRPQSRSILVTSFAAVALLLSIMGGTGLLAVAIVSGWRRRSDDVRRRDDVDDRSRAGGVRGAGVARHAPAARRRPSQ